jgi:urea transporter
MALRTNRRREWRLAAQRPRAPLARTNSVITDATGIAPGTVFNPPGLRSAVHAVLGTVFTVVAQAALNVALTPLAIPELTGPFVPVTSIFLLPQPSR